jgi:hypothetical protein
MTVHHIFLGDVKSANLYAIYDPVNDEMGYTGLAPAVKDLERYMFDNYAGFSATISRVWNEGWKTVRDGVIVGELGGLALRSAVELATAGRGTITATSEAFHYTSSSAVSSIAREGLRAGSYATSTGTLSPLQAQIDLALSPTGLRGALMQIDLAGLRQAGFEIPAITRVGRANGMPGGGFEMQFPYRIPPEFITVVRP